MRAYKKKKTLLLKQPKPSMIYDSCLNQVCLPYPRVARLLHSVILFSDFTAPLITPKKQRSEGKRERQNEFSKKRE